MLGLHFLFNFAQKLTVWIIFGISIVGPKNPRVGEGLLRPLPVSLFIVKLENIWKISNNFHDVSNSNFKAAFK